MALGIGRELKDIFWTRVFRPKTISRSCLPNSESNTTTDAYNAKSHSILLLVKIIRTK